MNTQVIGYRGENGTRDVRIPIAHLLEQWPDLTPAMVMVPVGGSEDDAYLLSTTLDGTDLVWHVTDSDTIAAGTTKASVRMVGADGRVAMDEVFTVTISPNLSAGGEVPEGTQPWIDMLAIEVGKAQTATQDANDAAAAAGDAAERAEEAAEVLENAPIPRSTSITYQVGTSGTIVPTGAWQFSVPSVPQGGYLWTRTVTTYTSGDPTTAYSVARQGVDGSEAVVSVNGKTGVVQLGAGDVDALPSGGTAADASKLGGTPAADYALKSYVNGKTYADFDALAADGTAADSSKLGGKLPNFYTNISNVVADGAGAHNAIYRGKNIQDKFADGTLYTAISNGTFADLFIGDYFDISITTSLGGTESVRCLLAGFDMYWGCGASLYTHHAVVVPANCFATMAAMNSSDTTEGAYVGSAMYTTVLPVYQAALESVFGDKLITISDLLSNAVSNGASSGWSEYDSKIRLINESEVYGSNVWSGGYDVGFAKTQLPLFTLNPAKIVCGVGGANYASNTARTYWWLSSVTNSACFAYVSYSGNASFNIASLSGGVRPRWLIG